MVTRCLAKKIAEMGHDIYAGVYIENQPFRRYSAKLALNQLVKCTGLQPKFLVRLLTNERVL